MAFYLFNYGQVTQAAALFITYLVSVMIAVGTVVLIGWLARRAFLRRLRLTVAPVAGGLHAAAR
jgi:hypothetical protein